jgi:hypothetical protein
VRGGKSPRDPQVQVVEGRDPHLHPDLARTRLWGVYLIEPVRLGSVRVVKLPGAHAAKSRPVDGRPRGV